MTWQLDTIAPAAEVEEALARAAEEQLDLEPFDSWDDSVAAQMKAAGAAAAELAKLVDGEHGVKVFAQGHVHQNDYASNLQITVQQAPAPIEAPERPGGTHGQTLDDEASDFDQSGL